MAVYDSPQTVHMQRAISGKGGVPKQKGKAAKVAKAKGKKSAKRSK